MTAQANKPLHLPLLVGGIAAILVSSLAIGALAISGPGSNAVYAAAEPAEAVALPAIAAPGARADRCAGCGVIESTREIETPDEWSGVSAGGRTAAGNRGAVEAKRQRNSEITIRLQDGSLRVITDTNPARWRHGERVTIIAGVN